MREPLTNFVRLLLDECSGSRALLAALKATGHDVVRSVDVLRGGATDPQVFQFACTEKQAIVTHNCRDFIRLADADDTHAGPLLIYQAQPTGDLSAAQIAAAIDNVQRTLTAGTETFPGRTTILNNHYPQRTLSARTGLRANDILRTTSQPGPTAKTVRRLQPALAAATTPAQNRRARESGMIDRMYAAP